MVADSHCFHALVIGIPNCYDAGERFGAIYLHPFLERRTDVVPDEGKEVLNGAERVSRLIG